MVKQINNIEEAREQFKTHPYLYLVAINTVQGFGSLLIASERKIPLYEVYFMVNDANKEKELLTVISIQEIASKENV